VVWPGALRGGQAARHGGHSGTAGGRHPMASWWLWWCWWRLVMGVVKGKARPVLWPAREGGWAEWHGGMMEVGWHGRAAQHGAVVRRVGVVAPTPPMWYAWQGQRRAGGSASAVSWLWASMVEGLPISDARASPMLAVRTHLPAQHNPCCTHARKCHHATPPTPCNATMPTTPPFPQSTTRLHACTQMPPCMHA
jgi:hypothetical protein